MFQVTTKTFQFGGQEVTIETGRVARQATGAVLVKMGGNEVLCTVVGAKEEKPGQGFFPLSVHYQEKYYSVGRIPGGFFKREARPSEKETLTSRLIDRPIRPLFPKGYMNEVQVVCTVMSADKKNDPDIAAMIGTSAALAISGIPFQGPIGAARVGFTEQDGYILNPSYEQLATSELDMVVAGTADAVLMVESQAQELSEDEMLGAVLFAHQEMQAVVTAINELSAEAGKEAWVWTPKEKDEELVAKVRAEVAEGIAAAYQVADKMQRQNALAELRAKAVEALCGEEEGQPSASDVSSIVSSLEKEIVRARIVSGEPRIDGRDNKTVRAIDVQIDVLQGTHGSSLFTRGETQSIVTCTLGTARDQQIIDAIEGERKDPFMLHYNFPPYSVGECGRMMGAGRREIGHGRLARRGVAAVLPTQEEFPYTIRIVSEITESNGSSSMASVCGASLSMMDAGVPLKAPVAGIAMGLVKEENGFAVLTDILGDEDHLGDMDFKVAGTETGITALQMDIKITGITEEIMDIALEQAYEARVHILKEMAKVIGYARPELPDNAPALTQLKINPEKIRDVIGKGGATIRALTEETGASIDIEDDGTVRVYAADKAAAKAATDKILEITAEAEIGKVYEGKVVRIEDFGAFVNILPGKDGLVHISQIDNKRVEKVTDYIQMDQMVKVKVLDVDQRGRIKLSMKDLIADNEVS
ncbi:MULTISPECIES: polyribonucleotide nucleotidyltransferase [unclassified Neptuniibacter]|uniref:polyribonucleotide nucleotidyltransferase n=1 Tax=unclassified Neptuniibacter TaxID=2630693 RepID=UPI0026E44FA7|nr:MULTISPECIES: polyribonucleotide nucleotidyltransferase [unclassified Neptuniibacter]MDO6515217.1 polyribonucleotide nucleotidyltransferase [Neptuniibacter sp. 2_MG-2023]MDO6594984.1 polyribonucleotide nucleotidyltransferase [Neptuniibacter sp. 1_MG-2023]